MVPGDTTTDDGGLETLACRLDPQLHRCPNAPTNSGWQYRGLVLGHLSIPVCCRLKSCIVTLGDTHVMRTMMFHRMDIQSLHYDFGIGRYLHLGPNVLAGLVTRGAEQQMA